VTYCFPRNLQAPYQNLRNRRSLADPDPKQYSRTTFMTSFVLFPFYARSLSLMRGVGIGEEIPPRNLSIRNLEGSG
jgi:hypothetical protein